MCHLGSIQCKIKENLIVDRALERKRQLAISLIFDRKNTINILNAYPINMKYN